MRFIRFKLPLALAITICQTAPAEEKKTTIEKPTPAPTLSIPSSNKDKDVMPSLTTATELAKKISIAVQNNDKDSYKTLYFPRAEFGVLKDVKRPLQYFDGLTAEYRGDITKLQQKIKHLRNIKFDSFKTGYCKWKAVGTQYNNIAYWSCYRNKITISTDSGKYQLPIKTLINWGSQWYVTHLGHELKKINAPAPRTP